MDVYRIKPSENGWALYEDGSAEPMLEAGGLQEVMGLAEQVMGERKHSVHIHYSCGAPREFRYDAEPIEAPVVALASGCYS